MEIGEDLITINVRHLLHGNTKENVWARFRAICQVTMLTTESTIFWDVTPFSLVQTDRVLRERTVDICKRQVGTGTLFCPEDGGRAFLWNVVHCQFSDLANNRL